MSPNVPGWGELVCTDLNPRNQCSRSKNSASGLIKTKRGGRASGLSGFPLQLVPAGTSPHPPRMDPFQPYQGWLLHTLPENHMLTRSPFWELRHTGDVLQKIFPVLFWIGGKVEYKRTRTVRGTGRYCCLTFCNEFLQKH